jgi:dienelactone hydrolase
MQIQHVAIPVANPEAPRELVATTYIPDNPSGAGVLFLSGYGSRRINYAAYAIEVANETATSCLTVDLSGLGESAPAGSRSALPDHILDTAASFDFLADLPSVEADRIGVAGASYGGYLAVRLSGDRTPKSLMLRAPAIHETLADRGVLKLLGEFSGLVTLVESEFDETTDKRSMAAIRTITPHLEHKTILGANHALKNEERPVFQGMLVEWAAHL